MNDKLSGVDKAAILLLSLDTDIAGRVFKEFDSKEILEVSHAMVKLGKISPSAIEEVAVEFIDSIGRVPSIIGSTGSTERFLRNVLGEEERVKQVLDEIRGPMGRDIWEKLSKSPPKTLATLLRDEYPQTVALILSKIPAKNAANILILLQREFSFEVMKRMLSMDLVRRDVLDNFEKTLKSKFSADIDRVEKHDNNRTVAEIFNNFDSESEAFFMGMLRDYDVKVARKVSRLMFTFDDLIKIEPNGVQALLKALDKSKLSLALKNSSEEIRGFFIQNMSQRAFKLLNEEMESVDANSRKKDILESQSYVVSIAREMISDGSIRLLEDEEEVL